MAVIGVDVAEAGKGLDVVALDYDRTILLSAGGLSLTEAARTLLAVRPRVVCIDSPPSWATGGRSREAERQLARLGMSAFATPPDPGDHAFYAWMRAGFALYAALGGDFPLYRGGSVEGRSLEVFPAATAAVLAGELRPPGATKVRFRRRVLEANGVAGSSFPNIDRVDAALAALTGLKAIEGDYCALGEPDEGVIVLPIAVSSLRKLRPGVAPAAGTPPRRRPDAALVANCECGCGASVRRRFLPGHDARLKSRLLAASQSGDNKAAEELTRRGWLSVHRTAAHIR